MARTKDITKSITAFKGQLKAIERFISIATQNVHLGSRKSNKKFNDTERDWCYDLAIIKLFVAFETLMLECLICSMNNKQSVVSETTGISFGKLTVPVCEYLIQGDGFFDFKGKSGLVQTLLRFLPKDHWLVVTVKKPDFNDVLEQLSALRNFAAHDSETAKKSALKAIKGKSLKSAGAWLRVNKRLPKMIKTFDKFADEITKATKSSK